MNVWFGHYKAAMYKSRLIGMVAALVIVFCILAELNQFNSALRVSGEVVPTEAVLRELHLLGFAILTGILALWRIVILAWSKSHSYSWQIFSWWLLALALSWYIWKLAPIHNPCASTDNGVCFGIYDVNTRANFVVLAGVVFVLLSLIRFLVTAAFALILTRKRLK